MGVGAERVAQLSHQRGGRHAAPGDVADRDVHDPVGALHDVVPVAADLEAGAAGLVARGGVDGVDLRDAGEQAALQRRRDRVLLLVAQPPLRRAARAARAPPIARAR